MNKKEAERKEALDEQKKADIKETIDEKEGE